MKKLFDWLKKEFLEILPPTIFFFIALHLVALIRKLLLEGTSIHPRSTASIFVAALILGKAVLIANVLPIINRFPEKPLIYNITWKTLIYMIMATAIHYLERLVHFWKQAGSLVAGNKEMMSEIVWAHFIAIEIVLLVLVGTYVTTHEMSRVIGEGKMRRIFFGPLPIPKI